MAAARRIWGQDWADLKKESLAAQNPLMNRGVPHIIANPAFLGELSRMKAALQVPTKFAFVCVKTNINHKSTHTHTQSAPKSQAKPTGRYLWGSGRQIHHVACRAASNASPRLLARWFQRRCHRNALKKTVAIFLGHPFKAAQQVTRHLIKVEGMRQTE